jgi:DNA repair exonuclease SbcCD ATPase subunit
MGDGADDLKKDLSPARVYLEMLGKQLEQIEDRQLATDLRQQKLQSGQADLVSQMFQKLDQITHVVESKDPSAALAELRQAMEQLGRSQAGNEGCLRLLDEHALKANDPIIQDLRQALDEMRDKIQTQSFDLEEIKKWWQQSLHQFESSGIEYKSLQLELARIRSDQVELKALTKAAERVYLEPNDPAINELRLRLDQVLESMTRVEVGFQRRPVGVLQEEGAASPAADVFARDVSQLRQEQLESKLTLQELQQNLASHALPALADLGQRVDEGLAGITKVAADLSALRSVALSANQESSGEMVAVESLYAELNRLKQGQHETQQLLGQLLDKQPDEDSAIVLGIRDGVGHVMASMDHSRQQLDHFMDEIRSSKQVERSEVDVHSSLQQLQTSIEELVQRELSKFAGSEQVETVSDDPSQQLLLAQQDLIHQLNQMRNEQTGFQKQFEQFMLERTQDVPDNTHSEGERPWQELLDEMTRTREEIQAITAGNDRGSISSAAGGSAEKLNSELLAAYEAVVKKASDLEQDRNVLAAQIAEGMAAGQGDENKFVELQGQLQFAKSELAEAQQQIDELKKSQGGGGNEALIVEMSRLEEERDALRKQLESRAESAVPAESDDQLLDQLYDLQEELRQSQLEVDRLKNTSTSRSSSAPAVEGGDWEAQKRAFLAQLESEEAADEDRASELMSIREVIAVTDKALASKDAEISELQQLLAQQSENLGGVAVGAAAIEEILNHDELIQQERESLESMKAEWREKLGKAEIEISIERAKIAREKKELEAEIEKLQEERKQIIEEVSSSENADPAQKNRWFARLGLENR